MKLKYFDIYWGLLMILCSTYRFVKGDNLMAAFHFCFALYSFNNYRMLWKEESIERAKMSKKSLFTVAVTHSCLNGEVITVFENFEFEGNFTYEKYIDLQRKIIENMKEKGTNAAFNKIAIISKIDFDEE